MAFIPESQEINYDDYGLEATQLSQPPRASQRNSQPENSQMEPRRKYWALFIPMNPAHSILKLPWSKPVLQIGRGPNANVGNDVVLHEKRVSNRHCKISLGVKELKGTRFCMTEEDILEDMHSREEAPDVWIEDLKSSNGTFVNGKRLSKQRQLLQHGDEISLGHQGTADAHDVRYIFRSVGTLSGQKAPGEGKVGEVYERYQILETLGKGTFAEVKKAVDVDTGDMRAVKLIVKHRFDHDPNTLKLFEREIDICTTLVHENICRLLEWFEDPQHIMLVLEFIDGGDLLNYIMQYNDGKSPLPEEEAQDFTFQICRAMAFCHEKGVTHRDLKPENILVTKESESQGRLIKIADFGLAKMIKVEDKTMLKSLVGTPQYLAPEVVMQTKTCPGYENVVDSWSIGIIVYSMLTKSLPFDDNSELSLEQRIRARATIDFDRVELERYQVSAAGVDFIERLLDPDPTTRMTMEQALMHEWLSGPSSLPSEPSQSQPLFGDSMWNIQAFDSDGAGTSDGGDLEMDGDAARSDWTRPATMSATNFGSASMGASFGGVSVSSNDSFSQPMEKLRLSTANINQLSPPREEATASPPLQSNGTVEMREATPTPGNINGSSPRHAPMELDSSSVTVGAKRKMPFRAGQGDAFSSGELSPPPEPRTSTRRSKKRTTPPKKSAAKNAAASKKSPAKAANGRAERDTTPRAEPGPAHGRVTRAATARLTEEQKSPASRTRSHTRDDELRVSKSRRVG
ncbi:hypothetical protein CspeluHIS016_0308020 [Cutaneotrichosporon spelunceum]|uniref:Pkinase-domain-containing protein n=1 Tax=Cutaneotrichosporon spelunceum TaxID=1672016 RepID=A0AAD3YCH5_9TREE|nr:hypothetical protein CspeluHIS016_0308020 [Cutaneotrichosporon spelunceum]